MKKNLKQLICSFLVTSILISGNLIVSIADNSTLPNDNSSDYPLDEYVNNEVLITYSDGSIEVMSCESRNDVNKTIKEMDLNSKVKDIQPNYEYRICSTITNDSYSSYQWALSNDGSFSLTEHQNNFPVYDNPFSTPSAPNRWSRPWTNGGSGYYSTIPIFFRFSENNNTSDIKTSAFNTTSTVSSLEGIDINMKDALDIYNGGKRETIIALIDTGVDTNHEDFGDVFWKNTDEIAGNGIDDDNNGYIDDVNGWNFYSNNNIIFIGSEDNHGTHGAGSIVATSNNNKGICGIVSDGSVKIMVLKALGGKNGEGTAESVIKAIKYAESNGAVICNLSMGTEHYDNSLYNTMKNSKMLFVVAAGNESSNSDKKPSYPAAFDLDNILSAANLQSDGNLHNSSNYGVNSVDIAVPGSYILSLTEGNDYSFMTGTSMSAPILSASSAMLYSAYNDMTLSDVKNILMNNASPLNVLSNKIKSGGMLNLGASMKKADYFYSINHNKSIPYTDVSKYDELFEAAVYLYKNGIMTGTSKTTFSPDASLTRGMIITMLGRIAGVEPEESDCFNDVEKNSWYSGYVGWAVNNEIVQGYGDGNFGTNDQITSEQLNLILTRYSSLINKAYYSDLSGDSKLTRKQSAIILYNFAKSYE